ncbi:uracil-DNA glycosylase [bacterium]|jgi:uracil-DNA glycosylase|nr:uracil-DNA glycosylase [bacterium]NBW57721.1 uracil-DNA glycosylase [bacterium]
MINNKNPLDQSWQAVLGPIFDTPMMNNLRAFLKEEQEKGYIIYPKMNQVFRALQLTPFNKVKCVIIGQDPYHGPGQAEGLCFSVPKGVAPPPSLVNIFKELESDLKIVKPSHGSLESWAKQGVLLLNTTLTVRDAEPASHAQQGWEFFTDQVISALSAREQPIVFLLFGKHAQMKKALIDGKKHCLIEAAHPSPLSAYRGFFGSKPFSRTNKFLQEHNIDLIDWHTEDAMI